MGSSIMRKINIIERITKNTNKNLFRLPVLEEKV